MKKKKILFVCACNLNRSPTFEHYFKKNHPELEVRSAGTLYGYPDMVDEKLLKWANKVYVMDLSQAKFIYDRYREFMKKVEVVGISDQYDPDDEALIVLIRFWDEMLR